jgi:hypothetical protein
VFECYRFVVDHVCPDQLNVIDQVLVPLDNGVEVVLHAFYEQKT